MRDPHVLPWDFKSAVRSLKLIPRAWNALRWKVWFWGGFPGGRPGTFPRRHGKSYFRNPWFPRSAAGLTTTRSFLSARDPQGRYQSLSDQRTRRASGRDPYCDLGYSVREHTIKISPFQPLRSSLSSLLDVLKIAALCSIFIYTYIYA